MPRRCKVLHQGQAGCTCTKRSDKLFNKQSRIQNSTFEIEPQCKQMARDLDLDSLTEDSDLDKNERIRAALANIAVARVAGWQTCSTLHPQKKMIKSRQLMSKGFQLQNPLQIPADEEVRNRVCKLATWILKDKVQDGVAWSARWTPKSLAFGYVAD